MFLMRILPGVLKELVKHVPTVLFQTVEWSQLAAELPKISRRVLQKEGYAEIYQKHLSFLHDIQVSFTQEDLKSHPLKPTKETGEKWLELYFAQLFSPHGLFLDLRSHHFCQEGETLKWHPSGFWTQFNEDFRQGLLEVYEGFYLENEETYYRGLVKIGLIDEKWPKEEKLKLGEIFKNHFGSSLDAEMSFDLESFQHSIITLSDFLLKKKVKISKDFLYLGIYLVTLYSSLEDASAKLPVKKIYLDTRAKFIQ